jgi:hypothetical protein
MKKLLAIALVVLILGGIGYYYLVYKKDVVQAFLLPGWELQGSEADDRQLVYKDDVEIGFVMSCEASYSEDECLGLTPEDYTDPRQIATQALLGAQISQYRYSVLSDGELNHYDIGLLIYREGKNNTLIVIYEEDSAAAVELKNKIDDIFGK